MSQDACFPISGRCQVCGRMGEETCQRCLVAVRKAKAEMDAGSVWYDDGGKFEGSDEHGGGHDNCQACDDELVRRAAAPQDEFVDAVKLLDEIEAQKYHMEQVEEKHAADIAVEVAAEKLGVVGFGYLPMHWRK